MRLLLRSATEHGGLSETTPREPPDHARPLGGPVPIHACWRLAVKAQSAGPANALLRRESVKVVQARFGPAPEAEATRREPVASEDRAGTGIYVALGASAPGVLRVWTTEA